MKRPDETSKAKPAGKMPDDGWVKKYPNLSEHMGDDRWDDGKPREVSTLGLKCEEGRVVASLNDKEGLRSLYRSGGTVDEALKALDRALIDPEADWRPWNRGKGGKK